MEVYKISLFCLAVVTLNARQTESLALKGTPQDCACFPTDKDSIRISKLADLYGQHERKVIYLFRHLDTQQITIYIPNEEKQSNFPDLTVNSHEFYDFHKMVHLNYIFDNPSNLVTVENHIKSLTTTSNNHEIPHKPKHPGADDVTIPQHPTVNEIKPDSTDLPHGKPGNLIIIDNGKYQPSYVYPNTESNKLPLTVHEHDVTSVILVPEHENDHDVQPKPTVHEIKPDLIDHLLLHGEPIRVIDNNGKYLPSYVYPNTESNNLTLTLHEHDVNSVILVPQHENAHEVQPKPTVHETKPDSAVQNNNVPFDVNSVILVPQHENDHDVQPKPTVHEMKPDSAVQNNNVPFDVNSVILVPQHENDHDVQPKPTVHEMKPDSAVQNNNGPFDVNSVILVPQHENDHDVQPKPTVHEMKPDSAVQNNNVPFDVNSVILVPQHENDHDVQPKPTVHEMKPDSAVQNNNVPFDVNSVILVPQHENDHDVQPKPTVHEMKPDSAVQNNNVPFGVNSVILVPQHENDHDVQPKPTVHEMKPDSAVQNNNGPFDVNSVILVPQHENDHDVQPNPTVHEIKPDSAGQNNEFLLTVHEHVPNSLILGPGHENIVPNYPNQLENVDIIHVFPDRGIDQNLQTKPNVNEIIVDSSVLHHGIPGKVVKDNGKKQPSVHPNTGHNVKNSTQVESEHSIIVVDLYDKTANPLDGTVDDINVLVEHNNKVPSNLNQNTNNVHGDSTVIQIIPVLPNEVIHDSSSHKQTAPQSVTTKPKDEEDITLENSILSQETSNHFIHKVQNILSEDNDNVLLSSVNLKLVNSPVIDRWLIGEIDHIIKSGPGTLSLATINLNEIKRRLVRILAQNGLQFTENGYLIDIHGHILQITNLKLRRVMISDPGAYKKLLGGRKCVTPYEIPYLEAVFVSMVHPSKVLGLIPLRMSSLPGCRGGTCPGRPCALRKHRPVHHQLPTKLHMAPIYNKRLDGKGHYSHYNSVNKNGLLEDLNMLLSTRIGNKDDDKTHHGADEEEGLDIRIIGGNPATGSGTPVSSRGRSGYKESEPLFYK